MYGRVVETNGPEALQLYFKTSAHPSQSKCALANVISVSFIVKKYKYCQINTRQLKFLNQQQLELIQAILTVGVNSTTCILNVPKNVYSYDR